MVQQRCHAEPKKCLEFDSAQNNEYLPFEVLEEAITSGHKQCSVEEFLSVVNFTNRQILLSKCDVIVKAMNSMVCVLVMFFGLLNSTLLHMHPNLFFNQYNWDLKLLSL